MIAESEKHYLGVFPVDISTHPVYSKYTPADWAMVFVERYGQFDGAWHKAWALDQVARILKGSPIVVVQARWDNHKPEDRISVGEPSAAYLAWVEEMKQDGKYSYEAGVAP